MEGKRGPVGAPLVGALGVKPEPVPNTWDGREYRHKGTHKGCPYGPRHVGRFVAQPDCPLPVVGAPLVGALDVKPEPVPNTWNRREYRHKGTHKGCPYGPWHAGGS